MSQVNIPTPREADAQNLTELEAIAREIGAKRVDVFASTAKMMIYYVDPHKDDPESYIFFDELEIDLEDKNHKIMVITFPED